MEARAKTLATTDLEYLLRQLATAREKAKSTRALYTKLHEAWLEDHRMDAEAASVAAIDVQNLEMRVRETALSIYEDTQEKAICPGVAVRVLTRYDYDQDEAFTWAREHNMCLKLAANEFDAVCKQDKIRPDFVDVREVPQATIATDLEKVLGINPEA
jgi:hypothetical protein